MIKVDSEQKFDMVDMGPSPVPSFCCSTSCALRDHPPRAISLGKNDSDTGFSTMLCASAARETMEALKFKAPEIALVQNSPLDPQQQRKE